MTRRRHQPGGSGLSRRVGAGVVLGVAGFLALRFLLASDGFPALLLLRGELHGLQTEVNELDSANRRLRQAIDSLHGDSYAVEKIAREDLDLVAPGEVLYLFPAALGPEPPAESDAALERP